VVRKQGNSHRLIGNGMRVLAVELLEAGDRQPCRRGDVTSHSFDELFHMKHVREADLRASSLRDLFGHVRDHPRRLVPENSTGEAIMQANCLQLAWPQ
jgi:hypothetical protein